MRLAGIGRGVAHFLRAIPALVSSRQGIMPYCVAAVAPLNGIAAIGVWESTRQKTMDWIGGTAEGLHYEILLPEHYSVMQRYDPPRFSWTVYAMFAACCSAWSGVR
jgi:hypothetical protein